jgi:hypothetical protein
VSPVGFVPAGQAALRLQLSVPAGSVAVVACPSGSVAVVACPCGFATSCGFSVAGWFCPSGSVAVVASVSPVGFVPAGQAALRLQLSVPAGSVAMVACPSGSVAGWWLATLWAVVLCRQLGLAVPVGGMSLRGGMSHRVLCSLRLRLCLCQLRQAMSLR